MTVHQLTFTAPCDRCGGPATWHGVKLDGNTGTVYEVDCRRCNPNPLPVPTSRPTTHLPAVQPAPPPTRPRTVLTAAVDVMVEIGKRMRGAA